MKSPRNAPIALFAYNRPEHARRTVEALQHNRLASESDLIVYSDGPRTGAQAEAVQRTREYLRTIDGFRSVRIIERAENMGLARSIIDGVTAVVNEYGRVIVLEDDLVTAPGFLEYMNDALEKYAQDDRVMQVSGYMFPLVAAPEAEAFFLPLATSWGWATWGRAWRHFDPTASGFGLIKKDPALRKRFNLDGAYDYVSMLEDQMAGRVDSWAVRWQLSVFLKDGLVLYPRYSLVTNAGFDGSGTHGAMSGALSRSSVQEGFTPRNLPQEVVVGEPWEAVRRALRSGRSPTGRVGRWLRKICEAICGHHKWPR